MNATVRKGLWVIVALTAAATLLLAPPVYADAWSASWGRVDGLVMPPRGYDQVVWNADWLLYAEAEVHHNHPAHTSAYDADTEQFGMGDGLASVGPVQTADLARVLWVQAGVASGPAPPFVDIGAFDTDPETGLFRGDVFSYAHDPATMSDAAGLGQHDNGFRILWTGDPGQQPLSVVVDFALTGDWHLGGGTTGGLPGYWWADWLAFGEVYDALGNTLGSDSQYRARSGSGPASDGGDVTVSFVAELQYDTTYSFNFGASAESHAEVPEPAALCLTAMLGVLLIRRRPNRKPRV